MALLEAKQFRGLIPPIDRRKINEPYCVDGRNFLLETDGPITGFARKEIFTALLADSRFTQSFTTDTDSITWFFTAGCVLKIDWTNNFWDITFVFLEPTSKFPWTKTVVGGKFYFARKDVGLIQFDPLNSIWKHIDGITYGNAIPANIVGCATSGGRLVVVADGILAWSVIDDGTDFATSTSTGAGFQSLGLVGAVNLDSVIGVYSVADGVITFTKNGIMKSQITNSVTTFRHLRMAVSNFPINPWCIATINDSSLVYLSRQGFYRTAGQDPEIWQPLMGEHFRTSVLMNFSADSEGLFMLRYLATPEWLFVSIAEGERLSFYDKSYVWSPKTEQWGSFNRTHTSILDLYINDGVDLGYNSGYTDSRGNLHQFSGAALDLKAPEVSFSNYNYLKLPEMSVSYRGDVAQMPSVGIDETFYDASIRRNGQYDIFGWAAEFTEGNPYLVIADLPAEGDAFASYNADLAGFADVQIQAVQLEQLGLDAFVEVGMFRLKEEDTYLEYTMMTNVAIGTVDTTAIGIAFFDMLTAFPESDVIVDMMEGNKFVDMGGAVSSSSIYKATINASIDGVNSIDGIDPNLYLVKNEKRTLVFASDAVGVFFSVKLEALEVGESFQLKTVEFQGRSAGRFS